MRTNFGDTTAKIFREHSDSLGSITMSFFCMPLLTQFRQETSLIGVEVVEYNPYHDADDKMERLIKEILLSIFGV
jgi:arginase family enzyme